MRSSWSDWILRFCMDWPFIKTSDSNRFDGIWFHSVRLLKLAQVIILQNMKQREYVRRILNNICQGKHEQKKKKENTRNHFTASSIFRIVTLRVSLKHCYLHTNRMLFDLYSLNLLFWFYSIRFVELLINFPLRSKDLSSTIKRLNTLPSNADLLHRAKMPNPTLIFLSK